MPTIDDDNPLWKPGTYPHDSGDGEWHKEFWAIRVVTTRGEVKEERWLTGLRTVSDWAGRIRFLSKTEARKWYWDTVLCHVLSYGDKRSKAEHGLTLPVVRVTL